MARTKLPLLALFLLFIAAAFASAAVDITPTTIPLNVDYELFDDDNLQTIAVNTDSFTLINPTAVAITVTITATDLPSGYTAEQKPVTVAANGTSSTTLRVNVPHREGPGDKTIGNIAITEAGAVTKYPLVQKTKSMFSLKEITVSYTSSEDNDEEDNFKDENDATYDLAESVKPGTEVVINFELENLFDNNYDEDSGTFEDVQINLEPSDDDFIEGDFEEDYDVDNIDMSDSVEKEIRFTIAEDADEDTFSFEVTIQADDGEGISYEIKKELTLKVERENNDLRITEAKLSPETITACDASFTLSLKVKNFGTNDQREAAITAYNLKLGINENIADLKINDISSNSNSWQRTFTFPIKAGTKEGTYPLDINAYINDDDNEDNERVEVVIAKCPSPEAPDAPAAATPASTGSTSATTPTRVINTTTPPAAPTATTSDNTNTATNTAGTTRISSAAILSTVEDPYAKEDYLIAALVVAIVAVLTLIVLFFIVLLK